MRLPQHQLTEEHLQQLRTALRGHELEAIITLAIATGARRDELLRLTWQEIDLERGEVRFLNSKRSLSLPPASESRTQRESRLIRLPEEVIAILKQHRLRQAAARLKTGTAWRNLDLVFPNRTGGFLRPDQLVKGFHEILAQAELPAFRFHDLRLARGQALHKQNRSANEGGNGTQEG